MALPKIPKPRFANFFALVIFLCCMIYFFWASFYLTKDRKELIHIAEIKIAMITICTVVVTYYFGSMAGSANKDAIMKDMTETNKTLTDAAAGKSVT
jgi:hypothetical protein